MFIKEFFLIFSDHDSGTKAASMVRPRISWMSHGPYKVQRGNIGSIRNISSIKICAVKFISLQCLMNIILILHSPSTLFNSTAINAQK